MSSRFAALLLILALAGGPASADVTNGGSGLVFDTSGPYAFKLGAPQGWMFDNDQGHNPRGVDIMYPKGRSWKASPVFMEGEGRAGSLSKIMQEDLVAFKKMHGAASTADPPKDMKTGDARRAIVRRLSGADGAVTITAYIEMTHAWATLVQRAKHAKDVDMKAFGFMLQSFETVPPEMIQTVQACPSAAPTICIQKPCHM